MKGILVKGMLALLAVGIMAAMMVAPAMSADPAVTSADVNNSAPYVCDKWEEPDDDNVTDGVQVMPNASGVKVVTIKACVCDPNGPVDDIANVTAIVTGPAGNPVWNVVLNRDGGMDIPECPICGCGLQCIGYSEEFNMDPDDPAGIYTVVVTVTDKAGATDTMNNTFEYLSLIAMTAGDVAFGSLAPGENSTATSNVTCTGNVAIEFVDEDPAGYNNATAPATDGIEWSPMTSGGNTIIDDQITTAWSSVDAINRTSSALIPFTLDVPSGIPVGVYTGTITFAPTEA